MTRSPWIDVTVALRDGMVTWPGDPPPRITLASSMERGDPATVSELQIGAHTGTHMDAPAHFIPGGKGIDEMPADAAMGPARVILVRDRTSIEVEELAEHPIERGDRVLFKTRHSEQCWAGDTFAEDFVYLSASAAEYLVRREVRLVGIDYLSVGGLGVDGDETHRLLLEAGIWIIEGLDLSRVRPGLVELVCLPLKIAGGDGAPARAFVRELGKD